MNFSLSPLIPLLGHFHPLLVHLPIGGLLVVIFLELLGGFDRWRNITQNCHWILGFAGASAVAAAACGWVLAQSGGYDPRLLKWHRAMGIALTVVCLVAFGLRQWRLVRIYRPLLAVALGLLIIAGHLGGSLTHGSDFLTWKTASQLPSLAELPTALPAATGIIGTNPQAVFAGLIQPVLLNRCAACHGAEKHRGNLRLDSLEGVLRGGHSGPVITAGREEESPLIQRLLLPIDEDGHMPPDGHAQVTAEELKLLKYWVKAAAGNSDLAGEGMELKSHVGATAENSRRAQR